MRKTIITVVLGLISTGTLAYDDLVTKNEFHMNEFITSNQELIKDLKVGWESYGTLNQNKDNVILITHYFGGNSHAAGKYKETDKSKGYWDSIIGAGKAIDTDKYFVISVDSLVNMEVNNPNVITTGPASINPDTGNSYGMEFPIVTIKDFVNVQKSVLDSLGIKKLHAVMGASMGGLQAYEWASTYPEMVERVIPVISSGYVSGNLIGWLNIWSSPIKLDPNWKDGNYYKSTPPIDGLAAAFKIIALHGQSWEWANESYGRNWADKNKNPENSYNNIFEIEAALDAIGISRAQLSDANHFLYLAKACQLFYAGQNGSIIDGLSKIKSPTLLIYSEEDQIFIPEQVRKTASIVEAYGTSVKMVEIQGTHGHFDGVISIKQASEAISEFLDN
ncbi:E22 family MetX-like putative esterase [Vibrio sp. MA64]|uniref:E22 family MetX-like putative esterase n=1 Tax=Vibrio sp. MA64 TaxID=2896365 RepID=UPI001E64F9F3|nr:homoserine O-acetyltransferase [Vibrio sp. MA64]MCC9650187.1 homoserine O-acetyltransferase [Vibrio sp. MA64]